MNKKQLQQILAFLHKAEKLKMELRHSWLSNGRRESIAEHTWRMALMAIFLAPYNKNKLNTEKLLKLIICHDLIEIEVGDMPRPHKPDKKLKQRQEQEAVEKLSQSLPSLIGNEIKQLWLEFEFEDTLEAQFARALDKLEVAIQHDEADIKTWDKKAGEYGLNLHGQDDSVSEVPLLQMFNTLIYAECRKKIVDAGLDVEYFEKEWKHNKSKY